MSLRSHNSSLSSPTLSHPSTAASTLVERRFSEGDSLHTKASGRHSTGADLVYKNGELHHRFEPDKVPWPMSYEPKYLELEAIDRTFATMLGSPLSYHPFTTPPKHILDMGCGIGSWVIQAAQDWKESTFVGFDLVDIQVPTNVLDAQLQTRIEWIHGNFLTTRLPFDDDQFDYVRLSCLARGIPESKWSVLLEEVHRVLAPGGAVEIIDEDIIFPTLPRWFTTAIHPEKNDEEVASKTSTADPSSMRELRTVRSTEYLHSHALVESLFNSVFIARFINLQPTSIITMYFTGIFDSTATPPARDFPMPSYHLPVPPPEDVHQSPNTNHSQSSPHPSIEMSFAEDWELNFGTPWITVDHANEVVPQVKQPFLSIPPRSRKASLDSTPVDDEEGWTRLYGHESVDIYDAHPDLSTSAMAMHLFKSFQNVLACKEAMWEAFQHRIRTKPHQLMELGLTDLEELSNPYDARRKFLELFGRYESDMRVRLSLSRRLSDLGWTYPTTWMTQADSPLRPEVYERLREAIAQNAPPSSDDISRRARAFTGVKGA